ncbi:TIGR03560 family F420-dependent LLM class oxidoreductase [Capillimicrobium parvum]|nr:TIGR03560 family F420-dependent LLM class oxidoreductase [Capillimicrobium parvum]
MDLCVMIEGQEGVSWPQWQALADACERHGIPALFRSDHYLPLGGRLEREVHDAWATICALAATTERLRLGTLVSPATFRHPSVLAKLAAGADQISGGRIDVGLGAGWNEAEHAAYGFPFGTMGSRMEVFAEQLEIVHGLWTSDDFSFAGEHYRLTGVDALPKPVQRPHPRLIVGGVAKPRTVQLAARWADEYNTVFAGPQECRERRAAVAAAWAAAGRDPGTLVFSLMTGCVAGRDEAELARRTRRLQDEHGMTPPAEWVTGTPDAAIAQLRALRDAGVDRVMLQLLLHDELEQIELIGTELAPALA